MHVKRSSEANKITKDRLEKMPPAIALSFSIVFIFLILGIDIKNNRKQSYSIWLPLLWFLISASKSITLWLDPNAETNNILEGSPIDRMVLSILMLLGLIILYKKNIHLKKIIHKNKMVFILFLYMGLSSLWSNFTGLSFKRWIRSTGDLVIILIIMTEEEPDKAIINIFKKIGYILIPLSIIFIKYYRNLGVSYAANGSEMWIGVTTHKNQLGQLACISSIIFLWDLKFSKKQILQIIDLLYFIMSIWILTGSPTATSQTSIGVFFISITIFIVLSFFKGSLSFFKGSLSFFKANIFLVGLIILFFISAGLLEIMITLSGRDMTLTGRTILWKVLMDIAASHPIKGVGYGSFWLPGLTHNLWGIFGWNPTSAHNGYIDVYIHLGITGLFLLFLTLRSTYGKIVSGLIHNFEINRLKMVLFTLVIVYNITESSFTNSQSIIWLIFLLISLQVPKNRKVIMNLQSK